MATSASAADSGSTTGFLDLPAEIRNTIYELALTPNPVIEISRITNDRFRKCRKSCDCRNYHFRWSLTLQRARAQQYNKSIHLLRSCKIVRSEATPVLYGANQFDFVFDCHFVAFINMIGDSAVHLRHIYLKSFRSRSMFISALVCLRGCKGLRKIKLSCESMRRQGITGTMLAMRLKPFLKPLTAAKKLRGEEFSTNDIVEVHSPTTPEDFFYQGLASHFRAELKNELERLLK